MTSNPTMSPVSTSARVAAVDELELVAGTVVVEDVVVVDTVVSVGRVLVVGSAAVEQAAKNAGHDVKVPFAPGRADAIGAGSRPQR